MPRRFGTTAMSYGPSIMGPQRELDIEGDEMPIQPSDLAL